MGLKRVLVCDDSAFMRKLIISYLLRNGFTVAGEAENGEVAIEQYKALRPDIVTMDITMPKMDGLSALKGIMAFDSKAKVVMMSSMGQEFMVIEAVRSGAKHFLVKPFKEKFVVETLNLLLKES